MKRFIARLNYESVKTEEKNPEKSKRKTEEATGKQLKAADSGEMKKKGFRIQVREGRDVLPGKAN